MLWIWFRAFIWVSSFFWKDCFCFITFCICMYIPRGLCAFWLIERIKWSVCMWIKCHFIYAGLIYWWRWRNFNSQKAKIWVDWWWLWVRQGESLSELSPRFSRRCADAFNWQEEAADHSSPETSSETYVFFLVVYWPLNWQLHYLLNFWLFSP